MKYLNNEFGHPDRNLDAYELKVCVDLEIYIKDDSWLHLSRQS